MNGFQVNSVKARMGMGCRTVSFLLWWSGWPESMGGEMGAIRGGVLKKKKKH